ncbi:MAG: lipoprotein-releasing system ATP-binding protein LolD [Candidatus Pelagibacter sp.]|nr:lipoprotein-releasing system ATP-binding protein LolD [Candidatus Pelagibacter sp.]|tara:strand:- start:17767 stop:18447 length:681 start_codon:yes stop_codon:yes gene_type:complete
MIDNFLEIKNINKIYLDNNEKISILKNSNFKLPSNKLVCLTGPSGSGKSTLLHLLSLLDTPNTGSYSLFSSENLFQLSDYEKSNYRKKNISIVFQNFNLISDLTTLENVMLPNLYLFNDKKKSTELAYHLLKKVGLENRLNHTPRELSGGEQQRVAVARCLINEPKLILADEPTGSLDSKNTEAIIDMFVSIKNNNSLIIFATHNKSLVNKSDLELTISDGTVNFN